MHSSQMTYCYDFSHAIIYKCLQFLCERFIDRCQDMYIWSISIISMIMDDHVSMDSQQNVVPLSFRYISDHNSSCALIQHWSYNEKNELRQIDSNTCWNILYSSECFNEFNNLHINIWHGFETHIFIILFWRI